MMYSIFHLEFSVVSHLILDVPIFCFIVAGRLSCGKSITLVVVLKSQECMCWPLEAFKFTQDQILEPLC